MSRARCNRCGNVQYLEEFYVKGTNKDGSKRHDTVCKMCRRLEQTVRNKKRIVTFDSDGTMTLRDASTADGLVRIQAYIEDMVKQNKWTIRKVRDWVVTLDHAMLDIIESRKTSLSDDEIAKRYPGFNLGPKDNND